MAVPIGSSRLVLRDPAHKLNTDVPEELLPGFRQQVEVNLLGRFMLTAGHEYPCQVTSISPLSAHIIAPAIGEIGDFVVAYIDYLGRFEGRVLSTFEGGFEFAIDAQLHKREKLAQQIATLTDGGDEKHHHPITRRHERMQPTEASSKMVLDDGRTFDVSVIDVSLSGAAIRADFKPQIGDLVSVGKMHGRVVRHADFGFAIEFMRMQKIKDLEMQTSSVS